MTVAVSAWKLLFPQSITLETYTGIDGYGSPGFASSVSISGLVVQQVKKITDAQGQEKVSMTQVYMATTTAIGIRDRITLPTAFTPSAPRILRVERQSDKDGIHHCIIFC